MACEGYMAVTAHCINKKWEVQSLLLNCFKISDRHTAENLRNLMVLETNKWDITKKVHTVVTDNAANIVAAVRLTGWNHHSCFAHSLNLIVQDSIGIFKVLQSKEPL